MLHFLAATFCLVSYFLLYTIIELASKVVYSGVVICRDSSVRRSGADDVARRKNEANEKNFSHVSRVIVMMMTDEQHSSVTY